MSHRTRLPKSTGAKRGPRIPDTVIAILASRVSVHRRPNARPVQLVTAHAAVTLPRHRIERRAATQRQRVQSPTTIRSIGAAPTRRLFRDRRRSAAGLMCKLLIHSQSRVVIFYRKPRYTHYCSVWNIILGELYQKCSI